MNTFHIVCITDEKYAMPTGITLVSLKKNKHGETKIHVHILCNGVSPLRKEQFLAIQSLDFLIELMDVTNIKLPNNIELLTEHVSITALYKFFIPSLFPDLERVLYIDGDVIVQADITELYNLDMTNKYAAVVKDMSPMVLYKPVITKKLGVSHSAYFNSGVMLLNLSKMREDSIEDELFNYRIHGINFFMDQDAFNVVFKEQVIYMPIWYNYLVTLDNKFSAEELGEYYEEAFPIAFEKRWEKAKILHMASKKKPWIFQLPVATDLFMEYYRQSPYCEESIQFADLSDAKQDKISKLLMNEEVKVPSRLDILSYLFSNEQGCNKGNDRQQKIIVSLTSFPARIKTVDRVVLTLLKQSMKPDHILLWLAEDDFPRKEAELPWTLLGLRKHGLTICWCDNLYPHKKYFYSMQKYPDDIIITVDDDVAYSRYLVETLFKSYTRHPRAVSAMRTHLMKFSIDGRLLSYSQWYYQCLNYVDVPLRSLFATGVGGVLYPPHLLNEEWKNKEVLKDKCLYADDIWLKIMQIMNDIPVVLASRHQRLVFVDGTQNHSLYTQNVHNGENDIVINKLFEMYNCWYGEDDTLERRIQKDNKNPGKLVKAEKARARKKGFREIIKGYVPMPVNSVMREFNILKKENKQIRFILYKEHEELCKNDKQMLEKLDCLQAALVEQQERIQALQNKLSERE